MHVQLGIIGDFDPGFEPHPATNEALAHCAASLDVRIDAAWLPTPALESQVAEVNFEKFDGLWCAPGSPYRSLVGALRAIRFARERQIPFIGTCGGYQHAVLEYSRNVMHISDAAHAEYDPYASNLFIARLACSLAGQTLHIQLEPGSIAARAYGCIDIEERFYCNFGLNPEWQKRLHEAGLLVVGVDQSGEARVLELRSHPFFIATLFVPQVRSRAGAPHPLVMSFIRSACARAARQVVRA